ncbi:acyl-CoA dehydrogenase family protein [Rhodococcus sp. T7]|uniref:acyl-CoA dehydrogenase family protein n=1 Tax=Rhodococcus sp. T7 TaxID=627444 RepID=UPI001F2BF2DE|nr:acyl-CoA dehydrogenase [Rhodococcus sp. T7]
MGLLPPGVRNEWSIRGTSGTREGTEWLLSGAFNLVPYGHEADVLMVDAELEGRGRSLVILRLPDEGVSTRRQRVIGGEPRAAVHLDGARISESRVLAVEPSDVARSVDRAIDTAIVLQCAHTVGACEAALELSVTWAKDRSQFGRPIGSFQSVSNRCADMRSGIDAARLLTWEAAWALGRDRPDASELVSVAKHYLNQVGDLVERNAHQVHGAIGYSTEYPLHVFTRLIKAFQASYGTSSVHLERVAEAIGL